MQAADKLRIYLRIRVVMKPQDVCQGRPIAGKRLLGLLLQSIGLFFVYDCYRLGQVCIDPSMLFDPCNARAKVFLRRKPVHRTGLTFT